MAKTIEKRASFEYIRYANCWEDADILLEALLPLKDKNCLSIASAGDNSFALLACDPSLVVCVDLSTAQLACVELRKAVFSVLSYEEMIWFLGFQSRASEIESETRLAVYKKLRTSLSDTSRAFWDSNPENIENGIIYHGKFEQYFKLFRKKILPFVHSRKKISVLLQEKDITSRRHFYEKRWDTFRWKLLFKIFFSRFVMGRAGRDPEFFRYVKGSVAEKILKRTRHALTELSTHNNPYLTFILTGSFGNALPYYARPEHFETIRNNMERLEIFHGTTDQAFKKYETHFDAFNLSDIFEYMDRHTFTQVAKNIVDNARQYARIAYWNMLVPRRISEIFPEKAVILSDLSTKLAFDDKAFFYQSFFVDEVVS